MKNLSGIAKLGFTLAAYAAAACVGLSFVYTGTADVIAARKVQDALSAMKEIYPAADAFEPVEGVTSGTEGIVFAKVNRAKAGGELAGIIVEASGPSYAGRTTVLVGVGTDLTITAVKILENKDTPGLGANAASSAYFVDKPSKTTFYGQFRGKPISDPFEVKKDVVSITASTITSRSISLIVQAAAKSAGETLGTAASGGL